MAADQTFADLYEHYQLRQGDLRGLFTWDALHAAESHVALVNAAIARHIDDRGRADPLAILAEIRFEQRKLAAVYSVNAFVGVLNQMSPRKPKWLSMTDFDPRIAVLALAHQTLVYALEALRVSTDGDLTEHILGAAQDESVWAVDRDDDEWRLHAACAACAAFFRAVGSEHLTTGEEVSTLYRARHEQRGSRPPPA
jgi:hypothetical protein